MASQGKSQVTPGYEKAKRAFLQRNATLQEQAELRSKPVKAWPARLRRMYKASRR
ncbi:MAG TPA: hypothetical protein VJA25_03060 [Dehalococcoidia bacterium]|nr:hypothetical protein [Dehalococcoidia bacterium]